VASKNQHVSTGSTRALLQARKEVRNAKEQQKRKDRKIRFFGLHEKTSGYDRQWRETEENYPTL